MMIDRESSKFTYAMDSNNPSPVVKRVMQSMKMARSGVLIPGCLPKINKTTVNGIKPNKKLIADEMVALNAKISGRT